MFSDMKLRIRICLGFGAMLLLLMFVGTFALREMGVLSDHNREMYEHPFTVSNTVLRVDGNIVRIHLVMKDVALAKNTTDINIAIQKMNLLDKNILSDFNIIANRFLGDQLMYERAEKMFRDWSRFVMKLFP